MHVFDWIISFFKAYSGYSKYGPPVATYVENIDEGPHEITMRTKIKVSHNLQSFELKIGSEVKKEYKQQSIIMEPKVRIFPQSLSLIPFNIVP